MVEEIKQKIKNKEAVSLEEYCFLLKNDKGALLAFMVSNNLGNVYFTLKYKLGFTELSAQPKINEVARTLEIMLEKDETNELQVVFNSFVLNTKGMNNEQINALTTIFK